MSFDKCVAEAISQGRISQEAVDALRVDADVHKSMLMAKGAYSEAQAKLLGEQAALEFRQANAKRRKYQKVVQHRANIQNIEQINAHKGGKGKGLSSLLVKDLKVHKGETAWSNIDNRSNAIEGQAHGFAANLLANLHTTHLGWRQNKELMDDTIREIFGQNTGNPKAKAAAESWNKTAEFLRERFNRSGGFIPKRDDWGMPQSHAQEKVAAVDKEQWVSFIMPLLNREAMLDVDGRLMSDTDLKEALDHAYTTIATGGNNKRKAGAFKGGSVANRHQDSRFLVFKDADNWLEYQKVYGEPDSFNVMTGHIRQMSQEIAMIEVLGPNPKHAFEMLVDYVNISGDKMNEGLIRSYYDIVSGEVDHITRGREAIAKRGGALRNWLMASQLGSALLSSVTDPIYGKVTRAFNGIPATKMAQRVIGQLNPANEADRQWAAHMGLVMDGWTSQALSSARFGADFEAHGFTSKMAESMFRVTGLQSWTSAQRQAFGLDFLWHLGNQTGKRLDDIEPKFQSMLRRYGISNDDWEIIRQASLEDHNGSNYFRPQNIYNMNIRGEEADRLTTKVLEAMNTEMDFSVPVPDARTRAVATWGAKQRGSVDGEVARFTMMYKSFALTQFFTHMNRGGKVYPITLGIKLWLMGAVAIQLKEIAKGREPKDWDNPTFWGEAFFQGGGAGIFGDFISSMGASNRFGNSFAATLTGTGGVFLEDTVKLAMSAYGTATDPFTGDDTNLGREAVRFAKKYTPYNNVWFARTATERLVWDNLQSWADPKAMGNWNKYENKRKTEFGQEYWWERGEAYPQF